MACAYRASLIVTGSQLAAIRYGNQCVCKAPPGGGPGRTPEFLRTAEREPRLGVRTQRRTRRAGRARAGCSRHRLGVRGGGRACRPAHGQSAHGHGYRHHRAWVFVSGALRRRRQWPVVVEVVDTPRLESPGRAIRPGPLVGAGADGCGVRDTRGCCIRPDRSRSPGVCSVVCWSRGYSPSPSSAPRWAAWLPRCQTSFARVGGVKSS
jgi:hypothetical protein